MLIDGIRSNTCTLQRDERKKRKLTFASSDNSGAGAIFCSQSPQKQRGPASQTFTVTFTRWQLKGEGPKQTVELLRSFIGTANVCFFIESQSIFALHSASGTGSLRTFSHFYWSLGHKCWKKKKLKMAECASQVVKWEDLWEQGLLLGVG